MMGSDLHSKGRKSGYWRMLTGESKPGENYKMQTYR